MDFVKLFGKINWLYANLSTGRVLVRSNSNLTWVVLELYLIIVQDCKFVNLINLRLYLSRALGADWYLTKKAPSTADREVAHHSHSSLLMSSPMAMLQKLIEEVQVWARAHRHALTHASTHPLAHTWSLAHARTSIHTRTHTRDTPRTSGPGSTHPHTHTHPPTQSNEVTVHAWHH